jgi:formamidopyrimidine-DNA glycosylase
MPELPEVETTRRGIAPYLEGKRVVEVVIRQPRLRWPIPSAIRKKLPGQKIERIDRRAKYLLAHTEVGTAVMHLGMSGSLRVLKADAPIGAHDHYDWRLDSGKILRFTDPRRFGSLLWQAPNETLEILANLGPEPLDDAFHGDYLWQRSRGRSAAIKLFLMDQNVVVGVGNIYASEALFAAKIHPRRAAGSVSRVRYQRLVDETQRILNYAIRRGGTTLRDFISPDGVPGYFEQELFVYGRAGEPCKVCGTPIRVVTLGQRSTFFCPHCQH